VALGHPDRLLVNQWHEAMFAAPEMDVPIFVHVKDRDQTNLPVSGSRDDRRQSRGDPDPESHGRNHHVPVESCRSSSPVSPGDTIWVQGGEWKAVLLAEGDREAYLASLKLLMELDFDLLVPWGSEDGQPYGYATTSRAAREKLQCIFDRLKAGENA
jgi:hypothetical protein